MKAVDDEGWVNDTVITDLDALGFWAFYTICLRVSNMAGNGISLVPQSTHRKGSAVAGAVDSFILDQHNYIPNNHLFKNDFQGTVCEI